MNTVFLLMAEFNSPIIPLSAVCKKYFGMEIRTAKRNACEMKLPIPFFKATESQKSEWVCHAEDLASYIENKRHIAREDFNKINPSHFS